MAALFWIAWLAAAAGAGQSVPAPAAPTATLTVNVVGARNARGKIGVSLFRDGRGFPDTVANAFRRERVAIDPRALTAQVVWRDLEPGVYAVAVLHDENDNDRMDKNFIGIPKEGYGASNNPPKKHRAPSFEEARFSLAAPAQTLETRLIY